MHTRPTLTNNLARILGIITLSLLWVAPLAAAEYVSISKDGVNIRSGPSTNDEIYWEVFKDFPLKVVTRKGDWAKTEDFEGDTGWVYGSLLNKKKTVIVKVKKANLRIGPGKNYEVVASALYGVVFYPGKRDGEWLQISHNDGTKGWVHASLVWP
ncbi:MAG: SH3 domain-containing protein [Desulfobulbaceae bacterium]|uniref:SH3 domain-containing protein n=1 Tax=Candidatus Desulfobia pelagia TaxID=2841692 RepID=A0A8J6NAH7_9BACT|nr:SH3 domain-containing protein [Candidatus Desulfobia pelagia]